MQHTPNTTLTHFYGKNDRASVCETCGNDVESWSLKNKSGERFYTNWGHKKDTKSRTAYSLVMSCPSFA